MTRINANIPVKELSDRHLMAEHREIKRIPNTIASGKAKIENIPTHFKLGTGHVKFFYDKQKFLLNRYKQIYNECISRGFNVQNYEQCWKGIEHKLFGDYSFSEAENNLVRERIALRNKESEERAKLKNKS